MKRILSLLLACFALTACFSACGRAQLPASEELSVVAANFPAYDFSRQVLRKQSALCCSLESENFLKMWQLKRAGARLWRQWI